MHNEDHIYARIAADLTATLKRNCEQRGITVRERDHFTFEQVEQAAKRAHEAGICIQTYADAHEAGQMLIVGRWFQGIH